MSIATILVAFAGLLCTILIALVGVAWRLSSVVTEVKQSSTSAGETLKALPAAMKDFRDELADHMSRVDARLAKQDKALAMMGMRSEADHRIAQEVQAVRVRVERIEAVCKERREASRRIELDTGKLRSIEDHGGIVEAIEPVGCPLEDEP